MKKLQLSMATDYYDIVHPLNDGAIRAEGIDLTVLTNGGERTVTVDRSLDVDMGSFSIWAYLWMFDQGMPWVALPVFPHRRFRHGSVFINTSKGITKPSDLAGKRIGGDFGGAVCRWMNGILDEHYGVPLKSVSWVVNAGYGIAQSRGIPYNDRAGVKLSLTAPGVKVEDTLADGEIDAFIGDRLPRGFGDGRVARLFPDFRAEETSFYQRTGVFPIMHLFKIKRELVEKHPWVAASICKALNDAKKLGYERLSNPRAVPLAFWESTWEDQVRLMGKDPWAYGLGPANRKVLEAAVRYASRRDSLRRSTRSASSSWRSTRVCSPRRACAAGARGDRGRV